MVTSAVLGPPLRHRDLRPRAGGPRAAGPDGYRRRTAGTWYAANTGHGQGRPCRGTCARSQRPVTKRRGPARQARSRDAGSADLRESGSGGMRPTGRAGWGFLLLRWASANVQASLRRSGGSSGVSSAEWSLVRAHPPGRVRGRLRLTMRRNDQGNDHQDRGSRKYEDHGGDAHEDPVLACLLLPLLHRDPGSVRAIARGRGSCRLNPLASARATEINRHASRHCQPDEASRR
jgi:hypothetical protein